MIVFEVPQIYQTTRNGSIKNVRVDNKIYRFHLQIFGSNGFNEDVQVPNYNVQYIANIISDISTCWTSKQ